MDPLPTTIQGVIARLNALIDAALKDGLRIGYFAALYERVTVNVRRAIIAGNVFQDNPRMEHLDVVFANRFLTAWSQYNGQMPGTPSACWQVAFDALDDPKPLVIQHLLLGMNAHINLDLGVAAAEIGATAEGLESLWPDFKKINDVLARLVGVSEVELGEISPRLDRIETFAPKLEDKIFDFGMDVARDVAWALARELVAAAPADRPALIARRDAETATAGRALYPLHGLLGEAAAWIRAKESTDILYTIQVIGE